MSTRWALTIWQPWATMIIEGWKPFEFRSWKPGDARIDPPDRETFEMAIHAGARPVKPPELRDLIYKLERGGDLAKATGLIELDKVLPFLERVLAAPKSLPMSSIIGYATVHAPIRNQELASRLGVASVNDSDRDGHSKWGWPLTHIVPQRPMIPVSGQRGLWPWKKPPATA